MGKRVRRRAVPALLTALLAGGCGGEIGPADVMVPARPTATLDQLLGPWQPTPFALDPAFAARVATACRRDIEFGAGSAPAVMDARGAGAVTVRMTGLEDGSCDALKIAPDGRVWGAGGGWRGGGADDVEPEPGQLRGIETQVVEGADLVVVGPSIYGRAGAGIARVEIETTTGEQVTATLQGSWFAAWWPQHRVAPRRDGRAVQAEHFAIRAYDATGRLLDEHVQ